MKLENRRVVLTKPLQGVPTPDNFDLQAATIPEPASGQFLVRHIYLSLDPYQRSAMAGIHPTSRQALGAQQMPNAEVVGQVVRSRHPDFAAGDYVRHFGGWQEYSLADGSRNCKIDPLQAPLSAYLGVLGMPGLTAWASVYHLAAVQPGQTVLVSAAAGPVGTMVGQLAMQRGARSYGIAGSGEKCSFVRDELGFADCIDYKQGDIASLLRDRLPDGVDMYHDNVGGDMLTAALGVLKHYGTVVLCGLISQYNSDRKGSGFNLAPVILQRAVMKGLIVYDFEDQRDTFIATVAPWVRDGTIRYREDRASGIEQAPAQFCRLMAGQNVGKTLVVIGPETMPQ